MSTIAYGQTNQDGRISQWKSVSNEPVQISTESDVYTLVFSTGDYYEAINTECFFPVIEVTFKVKAGEKYHVPLLLNPFSYSTYRGS